MGHALDETLQDILTRYHRMSGYETLWLPGTDHAGIATQNVVEKKLRERGLSRHDLGREKFLDETWQWANDHKSAILDQCKRLGASFDRSRERFTFDKGCSDAVKEVFIKLYEKGLIYKGKYIVNWCPRCQSAISDVETEYATEQGHMWEISYPLKGESGAIIVATTRPETIFGDVAIAVHPSDHKYSELIGKTVIIPLSGREIPIIADEYVDKSFGTGAVKITPAHDPNDFEVGKRHGLSPVWVIDEEGRMKACGAVPPELHGLDRYEAREKIIGMLSYNNFLLRTRDHEHNVGKCQRCGTTIEPLLSEQWFVKWNLLQRSYCSSKKTEELSLFQNVGKRITSAGWKIYATGAFPVNYGGVTKFLHITITRQAKWLLQKKIRILQCILRTVMFLIRGFHQDCGLSQLWAGRILKAKTLKSSIRHQFLSPDLILYSSGLPE